MNNGRIAHKILEWAKKTNRPMPASLINYLDLIDAYDRATGNIGMRTVSDRDLEIFVRYMEEIRADDLRMETIRSWKATRKASQG